MSTKKINVGHEVAKLLMGKSTLSYAQIAERVRKRVPEARTSPRSVASIAAALRASGKDIPDRRSKHA